MQGKYMNDHPMSLEQSWTQKVQKSLVDCTTALKDIQYSVE